MLVNCVPAGLDAAHVGFVFTDVMRSGHCAVRTCMSSALEAFDERQT